MGVDYIPTSSNYTWSLSDTQIEDHSISFGDQEFKTHGHYYVRVEAAYKPDKPEKSLNQTFLIEYHTGGKLKKPSLLIQDKAFQGQVQAQQYTYYRFEFMDLNQKDIVIDLTPISGNPDIVVSLRDDLSYPSHEKFDVSS
jgi:hypothetical protein